MIGECEGGILRLLEKFNAEGEEPGRNIKWNEELLWNDLFTNSLQIQLCQVGTSHNGQVKLCHCSMQWCVGGSGKRGRRAWWVRERGWGGIERVFCTDLMLLCNDVLD